MNRRGVLSSSIQEFGQFGPTICVARARRCARVLSILSVVALLAACGGAGSSTPLPPPRPQPPPPPPPAQVNPAGFWHGTALYRCDPYRVDAWITEEGVLIGYALTGIHMGTVSHGPSYDASTVKYQSSGANSPFLDALPDEPSLWISSVEEKRALTLVWSAQAADFCSSNSSVLGYLPTYARPASLAIISGVYTNHALTLSINSDGVVTGSDIRNCVFNGNVAVVHADRNYYSATIDVDNCVDHERLEGIVWLEDTQDGIANGTLRVAVSNPQHALWQMLDR